LRAAVHAGPGLVRVQDWPRPTIGPGELLLGVRGCGLCGSDLAKLRGPAVRPAVLGHEVVGQVLETGSGVEGYRVGDRVVVAHHVPCLQCHFCRRGSVSMCRAFKASNLDPGGFAEFCRVPPENVRHATFLVPDGMSDAVASFTEPLACCLRAIGRAAPAAGDVVLVAGLGAMGALLVQLARRRGATVVGVDPLDDRRELARSLGASRVESPESLPAALAEATDGRGADLVMLTVGAPAVIRQALGWVRDGGAVHLFVGEGEGPFPFSELYRRELTLSATYSSSPADLAEAFDLLRRGEVRVERLASHRLPLEGFAEAVRLAEGRQALKVFVEVPGPGAVTPA
jgi:L-iditol 2-dehydrogenase